MSAETLARVEDLYRPFKEKKNTKATIAKAKWLDPLADILRICAVSKEEFEQLAAWFIKDTGEKKTSVASVEEAIQGAKDIIAEEVSDDATLRDEIRTYEENNAVLETKPTKTFINVTALPLWLRNVPFLTKLYLRGEKPFPKPRCKAQCPLK